MFTRIRFFLLVVLLGGYNLYAQTAPEWNLDEAHTSVNFDVKHFFSTVNGSFNAQQGTFFFDPENLSGSKFSFRIPVSGIDTNNEKRDRHLKSVDFFNAEKFPEIIFESTKITKESGKDYVARGKLTIKDVTRIVEVPFHITGIMDHPMKENTQIMGLLFKTSLDRTDYGVGVGDWAATIVVSDNVDIEINMELNKPGST